jgi:hypothetical protein
MTARLGAQRAGAAPAIAPAAFGGRIVPPIASGEPGVVTVINLTRVFSL